MTIESILVSDENSDSTNALMSKVGDELNRERDAQETIDFKMVTFSLSGKDYAIDIMYVKEIAKAGLFTYVPNTLPFVIGVYNLRGEIIPILDMRIFFNIPIPETKENELRNLLILTVNEQTFGIVVDKIDKVVGVQKSSIQPPHPLFVDINVKYISGVVESNKHLYILLDIERIFSNSGSAEDVSKSSALKDGFSLVKPQHLQSNGQVSKKAENQADSSGANAKSPEKSVSDGKDDKAINDEQDFKFISEGLSNFAKFFVSSVNKDWVARRLSEWRKLRGEQNIQLQNAGDAQEFLKPFWSAHTGSLWSKEYADSVFAVLPENSAKQIVVWNPGCAKGLETYCLACVLSKRYPDAKIKVYAQDTDLLNVANAPMLTISQADAEGWLSPFVSKNASGSFTFNQQIKDSILFEYHDCQHTNAMPMIDLVFSRDLLSLLPDEARSSVMRDFDEKLKGNGILIIGDNESVSDSPDFMEHTVGSITVYKKQ